MDAMTEFAKMFKDRNNNTPPSITTGIVITPPPEVQIRLTNNIILDKTRLVFSAHMLKDYYREIHLKFNDENCGTTNVVAGHSHIVETLNVDTTDANYTTTDTIVAGDEVIIMPTVDEQLYFVFDKAVRYE